MTGDTYEVTLPTPPSPQPATYTVTISAGEEFTVNSVSITDPTATLAVDGSSSTQTSLTVTSTSATAFNNAGHSGCTTTRRSTIDGGFATAEHSTLDVGTNADRRFATTGRASRHHLLDGGSSLTIRGTLTNTGTVQVGNSAGLAAAIDA